MKKIMKLTLTTLICGWNIFNSQASDETLQRCSQEAELFNQLVVKTTPNYEKMAWLARVSAMADSDTSRPPPSMENTKCSR